MAFEVGVVDYRSPSAPAHFATSLRGTGFAVLVDHPLSPGLVRGLQEEWRTWFEADDGSGDKWSYLPAPGSQYGYVPMEATETAVGATVADIKEYFHWLPGCRAPEGPARRAAELYDAASALAVELLGWLDGQTPPDVLAGASTDLGDMLRGSRRTLLRILRYPPLTGQEAPGALRAAPHEDIDLLTVLPAATEPGLQVRDRSGTWIDVPADPGTVVVNAGDMLDLATAGHYPSTTHRVLLPTGDEGRARMSTPLFLHPRDDVELAAGVTAFDFLAERVRAISGVELAR